jgi:hypothetical protein
MEYSLSLPIVTEADLIGGRMTEPQRWMSLKATGVPTVYPLGGRPLFYLKLGAQVIRKLLKLMRSWVQP